MPLTDYPECFAPGVNENDLQVMDALVCILEAGKFAHTSKVLEEALAIAGPKLRACVNYLRCHSVPIASGSSGYWLATRPDGLDTTICHLEERRRSILAVIDGLYRARKKLEGGFQLDFSD